MPEKWAVVPFAPEYTVSTEGRLKYKETLVNYMSEPHSYPVVALKTRPQKVIHVARLVLIAFRGDPYKGTARVLRNGPRNTVRLRDLEWMLPNNKLDKHKKVKRLAGEVWKRIPLLTRGFSASSFGRIRFPSGNVLTCSYGTPVNVDGKIYRGCRLICSAFHGVPRNYRNLIARHLDGVGSNCRPSNLAWGTTSDNSLDTWFHKIHGCGKIRPVGWTRKEKRGE